MVVATVPPVAVGTILRRLGIKVLYGISALTSQALVTSKKWAREGYKRLPGGVAGVDLPTTTHHLLAQITPSDKSRQGWKRFVKSLKLMTKSLVVLVAVEFSIQDGEGDSDGNGADRNNHDQVDDDTLSPLIMINKNRRGTDIARTAQAKAGHDDDDADDKLYQTIKHEMGTEWEQLMMRNENISAAGDYTTMSPALKVVGVKTTGDVAPLPLHHFIDDDNDISGSTATLDATELPLMLNTQQLPNMKRRRLPLNHRRCHSVVVISEQEKCYQVKLSYVDKRIVCVNTPALHRMKSLKLY